MKKGKISETLVLPEEVIQHIQSYMSGKEAAQSAILSKSWYSAWLTRPAIDFDEQVQRGAFDESAKKTIQRYQNLNLKIESFRLSFYNSVYSNELIVAAMKIGATIVDLEFSTSQLILPQEVLGSKTLVRLSLIKGKVDASEISCSRLKSLTLKLVNIKSDVFKAIIMCCISMEELSLTHCTTFTLSLTNLYALHKLRRLFLHNVVVDNVFFTDFGSRFPCLKDLTVLHCGGYSIIQIASASLQTIRFEPISKSQYASFEVPNIRKFTYLGKGSLYIEGAPREWELDISIISGLVEMYHQELLAEFRLSRIPSFEHDKFVSKFVVVENLRMEAHCPSGYFDMFHLFEMFRPKFITQYPGLQISSLIAMPHLILFTRY